MKFFKGKKMNDWFYWALITACIWGIVPMFEKRSIDALGDVPTAIFLRSIGVVIGIVLLMLFMPDVVKKSANANWIPVLMLVGSGFVGSVIAQFANYNALQLGQVSRVSPVTASWPVITFLTGIFFLSEDITPTKVIALLLIAGGIILMKLPS